MKQTSGLLIVILLAACATVDVPPNRYGLRVVPDFATYERIAHRDPQKRLVDLASLGIPLDIRYATESNFMKRTLYPVAVPSATQVTGAHGTSMARLKAPILS